jgi:hypothetical protein
MAVFSTFAQSPCQISLTSAVGTDAQTVCVNTAITDITYAASGTSGSANGLPNGITGSLSNGVFTISGTPSVSGTFNYTVITTGGCSPDTSAIGTITVNPDAAISLTSTTGTDAQTICQSSTIKTITYSISGGATGASCAGLPLGVSASYSGGVLTISGTPNAGVNGTFNYTVTTNGTCIQSTATGSIIKPAAITLLSVVGTDAQTVCKNTAITSIVYSIRNTGGGGNTINSLPSGVTGTWNSAQDTLIISGTPTVTGTFKYNIISDRNCLARATGTITVNPIPTATISGTKSVCVNSINPIITFTGGYSTAPYTFTYNVNGGANKTLSSTGTTATISAPVNTVGTFSYNLVSITDANGCGQNQAGTVVITVNPLPTVSSTSATVCQGLSATLTASGANSYVWSTGTSTSSITDAPSTTTTYSVTGTSNGCSSSTTGRITVIAPSLSSTLNPNSINSGTTFTYTPSSSANGASFSWSRATVSGISETGTSGTGSVSEVLTNTTANPINVTYVYTTTASGCQNTGENVVVAVNPPSQSPCQISLTSGSDTQLVCKATPITPIVYYLNGGQATVSGLPSGIFYSLNVSNDTLTISGTPTVEGTYNYTVISTGNCSPNASAKGIITVGLGLANGSGSPSQAICGNTTLSPIVFNVVGGNATSVWTPSMPARIIGNYDAGKQTYTFFGTSTTSGIFQYTLTTTGSCAVQSSLTGTISVDALPVATVGAVKSMTICANSTIVSLSGTVTNATGIWSTSGSGSFNPNTSINATSYSLSNADKTSGNVKLFLTATGMGACAASKNKDSLTIAIDRLPSALAGGSQTICQNSSATISGTSASNGSISWAENGAGSITSGGTTLTPTYTPTPNDAGGTVILTMTVTSTNSCNPANATATYSVTFIPLPTASIAGTTTTCQNSTSPNITFTGTSGTPPFSFLYKLNGALYPPITSTGTTATVAVPTANTGAYTYSLVSVQDASTNACTNSQTGSATVTINSGGSPLSVSSATICEGSSATLQVAGANAYLWSTGATTSFITVSPTVTTNYTVTAAGSGCPSSGVGSVTVISKPLVSVASNTICYGNSATLSASGANSYVWSTGATTSSIKDAPISTTSYTVTGTSSGCSGTTTAVGTITVLSPTTLSVTSSTICLGATATLTATGANAYTWSTGATTNPLLVSPQTTSNYTVVGSGCTNLAIATVTVNTPPVISILSTNASSANTCNGYLEAVANGSAPFTYHWSDSAGVNSPYRHHQCNGTYSVAVTSSQGCIAKEKAYVGISTSANAINISVKSTDVTGIGSCDGIAKATITGGTATYTITVAGTTSVGSTLSVTNLCPGFYTANVIDSQNKTASFTFVTGSPVTSFITPNYSNSQVVDTLITNAASNCIVDYNAITSIKITNYAYVGANNVAITWTVYQGSATQTQTATYQYSLPGVYTFVLDLFCTNRSSGSVKGLDQLYLDGAALGIASVEAIPSFVYPNPFSNKLIVITDKAASVKITDIAGKEVYTAKVNAGKSTFDTESLSNGVYFITITDETGSVTKKLVKD